MVEYGEQFWKSGWAPLYGVLGGNPLAAMPSLHFATSVKAAHLLAETGPRGRARSAGRTRCTLGLALVYLGEHYVVDLLAGLALDRGRARARRRGGRAAARRAVPAPCRRSRRGRAPMHDADTRRTAPVDGARAEPRGGATTTRRCRASRSRARSTLVLGGFFVASIAAFLYFVLPQIAGLDDTWSRIERRRPVLAVARARVHVRLSFGGYVALFQGVFVRAPGSRGSTGATATRSRWRGSPRRGCSRPAAPAARADGLGAAARRAWSGARWRTGRSRSSSSRTSSTCLALFVCGLGLRLGLFQGEAPFGLTVVPAIFGRHRDRASGSRSRSSRTTSSGA